MLDIRATRLTLTASLKAAQLSSNLALMQILVQQAANRLSPQSALQRYYRGNSTKENWLRTAEDFDAIFSGDVKTRVAIQARIYAYNSSAEVLFSRTANTVSNVVLPYKTQSGETVTLGDPEGFIPQLYPRFTLEATSYNATLDTYKAHFNGRTIDRTSYLLSGPYRVNDTLSLVSITLPIINNTSSIETLGWLTTVLDASLITTVVDALEGLDESGLTLLFGPGDPTNIFPSGYLYDAAHIDAPDDVNVRFLVPPTPRESIDRHDIANTSLDPPPFSWKKFPAIRTGFSHPTGTTNNAGSIIYTNNEDGERVSVGYAVISSPMVDWMVVVEQLSLIHI